MRVYRDVPGFCPERFNCRAGSHNATPPKSARLVVWLPHAIQQHSGTGHLGTGSSGHQLGPHLHRWSAFVDHGPNPVGDRYLD